MDVVLKEYPPGKPQRVLMGALTFDDDKNQQLTLPNREIIPGFQTSFYPYWDRGRGEMEVIADVVYDKMILSEADDTSVKEVLKKYLREYHHTDPEESYDYILEDLEIMIHLFDIDDVEALLGVHEPAFEIISHVPEDNTSQVRQLAKNYFENIYKSKKYEIDCHDRMLATLGSAIDILSFSGLKTILKHYFVSYDIITFEQDGFDFKRVGQWSYDDFM